MKNGWLRRLGIVATIGLVAACSTAPPVEDRRASYERASVDFDEAPPPWRSSESVGTALDDEEIDELVAAFPEVDVDDVVDGFDSVTDREAVSTTERSRSTHQKRSDRPAETSGPVTVLPINPEDGAALPTALLVGFDRPMVADPSGADPGGKLSIEPGIQGTWRWIGAATAVFEADEPWPAWTEFTVAIPEGLTATDGTRLEESLRISWASGPAQVRELVPRNPRRQSLVATGSSRAEFERLGFSKSAYRHEQPNDAPIGVVFDRPVDNEVRLDLSVQDAEGTVSLQRFDDSDRRDWIERWGLEHPEAEGRLLLYSPNRDYADGSDVEIRLDGVVDADRVLEEDDRLEARFSVREPFEFAGQRCTYDQFCGTVDPVTLDFTSDLADDADVDVDVEPPVDNLETDVEDGRLQIRGDFEQSRSYTIRLPDVLRDVHNRKFGGQRNIEVEIDDEKVVATLSSAMVVRPTPAPMAFPIETIGYEGLATRFFDAGADDWETFLDYREGRVNDPDLVRTHEVETLFEARQQDVMTARKIETSPVFERGVPGRSLMAIEESWPGDEPRAFVDGIPRWSHFIQRTDLAADIRIDGQDAMMTVTGLLDGRPVKGAAVRFNGDDIGTTDEAGELVFDFPEDFDGVPILAIEDGTDELLVPLDQETFGGDSATEAPDEPWRWYIADDPGGYQAGKPAEIRGWIRPPESEGGAGALKDLKGETVAYRFRGPKAGTYQKRETRLDKFGGFELSVESPGERLAPREMSLALSLEHDGHRIEHKHNMTIHQRGVDEHFGVEMVTDPGPLIAGDELTFRYETRDYDNAWGDPSFAIDWKFEESPVDPDLPGREDWKVGSDRARSEPRQILSAFPDYPLSLEVGDRSAELHGSDRTDLEGRAEIALQTERPDRGFARRLEVEAGTDFNLSTEEHYFGSTPFFGDASLIVHPSSEYVGVRTEKSFVEPGGEIDVEALVVDLEGRAVEGREIEWFLYRHDTGEDEPVRTRTTRSAQTPVEETFSGLEAGSHTLVTRVRDDEKRLSETELPLYVAGSRTGDSRPDGPDVVELVPDREEYEVGDRAEILVQTPYYPVEATVDIHRNGLEMHRRVRLTREEPIVEFDITDSMAPNARVDVAFRGVDEAAGPLRYGTEAIEIPVARNHRRLDVEFDVEKPVRPGESIRLAGRVTNDAGEARAGVPILVAALDQRLLSWIDTHWSDPLEEFMPDYLRTSNRFRTRDWTVIDAAQHIHPVSPPNISSRTPTCPGVREARFFPRLLATPLPDDERLRPVYRTDQVTDGDGRFEFTATIPERDADYQLRAVAVGAGEFGTGTADLSVRYPIDLQLEGPDRLHVGDRADLEVVVDNRSEGPRSLELAIDASENLEILEAAGRRVELQAGERLKIPFAVGATVDGPAAVQIGVAGEQTETLDHSFPIVGVDETQRHRGERRAMPNPSVPRSLGVDRNYVSLDDPDDVVRTDEGWKINKGTRVRVELAVTTTDPGRHLRLVDRLPAGLTPVGPGFGDSRDSITEADRRNRIESLGWAGPVWHDEQVVRDDGIEAAAREVAPGSHIHTYVARATTAGEFVAPSARIDSLYRPELASDSFTELVTVVDE